MEKMRRVKELITPSLEGLGLEVVRVRYGGPGRPTLQIMIERSDYEALSIDECAIASRTVSALLDINDPIDQNYNLEISSPGLDRPLTRLSDFERFAGFEAKIELFEPANGRKRFRGRLLGLENDTVGICHEGDQASIPFSNIERAKLVPSDNLILEAKEKNGCN